MAKPVLSFGASSDGDRCRRGGRLADGYRVGVDVHRRPLPQEADEDVASGEVAAVDPECLAQCSDQHIDRSRPGHLLGPPARGAIGADTVRIVDNHDGSLLEVGIVVTGDLHERGQLGIVATHREHAVGHDQRSPGRSCRMSETGAELLEIEMVVDHSVGRPGHAKGIDDAVVIELVTEHDRLLAYQRGEGGKDRCICRRQDHGLLPSVESAQFLLEVEVHLIGTRDEPDRPRAGSEGTGRRLLGFDDGRMTGEPEVAVRVHPDE